MRIIQNEKHPRRNGFWEEYGHFRRFIFEGMFILLWRILLAVCYLPVTIYRLLRA